MKKVLFMLLFCFSFGYISNINAQKYMELVKYDSERNLLVFKDKAALTQVYEELEELLENQSEDKEELREDEIENNTILRDFGKNIGFYERSLRYTALVHEYEELEKGVEPIKIQRPDVKDKILQSLMNDQYAIQVGDDIVLLFHRNRAVLKEYDLNKISKIVENQINKIDDNSIEGLVQESNESDVFITSGDDDCNPNFVFDGFSTNNEVRFTYTGSPSDPATVTYAWDFGDGSPLSIETNPSHKYGVAKNYVVCLTITQKKDGKVICTKKVCKDLNTSDDCTATFKYSGFLTDLTGKFTYTGKVVPNMKFTWDFGDGTAFSNDQNPTHTYTSKGPKKVCLTVESPNCKQSANSCQTIWGDIINTDCIAAFKTTEKTGTPCLICFQPITSNILSNDPIVSYEWTFGDGEKSTEVNPCHKYSCNGKKFPSLKLTTKSGLTCNSTAQSLIGISVNNCECCQKDVFSEEEKKFDNDTKYILCQLDSDQPWIGKNNVNAEMWYYEKNSKGNWKKKSANLQMDLWGNVLGTSVEGCKCKIPIAVTETGKSKNTHGHITKKNTNANFGQKKNTGEWGADFMVNGKLY